MPWSEFPDWFGDFDARTIQVSHENNATLLHNLSLSMHRIDGYQQKVLGEGATEWMKISNDYWIGASLLKDGGYYLNVCDPSDYSDTHSIGYFNPKTGELLYWDEYMPEGDLIDPNDIDAGWLQKCHNDESWPIGLHLVVDGILCLADSIEDDIAA